VNEHELKKLVEVFYDKWANDDGLWRNNFYPNITEGYLDFTIKVSFGQGLRIVPPKNPWMAFLKYGQRVSQGIYPIIIIKGDKLEVHLGVSQENEPIINLDFISKLKEDIGSKVFENFDIDNLKEHLQSVLTRFDNAMKGYNTNHFNSSTMTQSLLSKNIILYGSPGVGKTHNTNKLIRLIRLIEDGKSDREIFETIKANENSETIDISDIKERVKFITFHQSFGYEDFIEGFRPNEEGNIGLEKGIFLEICNDAEENLLKSSEERKVPFKEAFNRLFKEKIEKEESVKIDLKRTGSYFKVNDFNDKTIYFEKQSGTTKHTLSMTSLEKMYDVEKNDFINGGLAVYYEPILEKLLKIKRESHVEKIERKNYYLVIDEINRGNISKIFGELITLIEEDKRDNLEVTLPYSKKPFKIPSNLYIIGTMNSTDKSIALIDIALRRRFTFLKMKPKADLINDQKARLIFEVVNKKITETLGEDYQIGHSYFMKIQNDDDLDFVLEYKIIPLLEEYYYGDDRLTEVIALCKHDPILDNDD